MRPVLLAASGLLQLGGGIRKINTRGKPQPSGSAADRSREFEGERASGREAVGTETAAAAPLWSPLSAGRTEREKK